MKSQKYEKYLDYSPHCRHYSHLSQNMLDVALSVSAYGLYVHWDDGPSGARHLARDS